MADPLNDLPRQFGPYDVESILGRGAMGMVYLARDRRIGRKVALKTVHVEERFDDETEAREFYKRLQREAELCGSLQHPNIVTLYEPGYENDRIAWLATEYVDGESLRDRLKKQRPLPLRHALQIAEDILRGLAFAHSKGVIHRDIKPANILLTSHGDAKIADFGIARPVDSSMTAAGEMLGTPSYMSPEQVKCTAVTARSDLFSVGAVLYEMATGVKAFAATDVSSILRNVIDLEPRPAHVANEQVPASVSAVVTRLMAKDPDARYPSAIAALQDLEAIEAELGPPEEVEEVGGPLPVRTLTAARLAARETRPSITTTGDDLTTPMGSRDTERAHFDRPISTGVFASVVAALLLAFGSVTLWIHLQTDDSPTVTFSAAELEHFRQKKEGLIMARTLYAAGQYERALKAYDDYLAAHPRSLVAAEERAEAQLALEAQAKSATADVSITAKRPQKSTPVKKEEPAKRPSFWRRIFGRG